MLNIELVIPKDKTCMCIYTFSKMFFLAFKYFVYNTGQQQKFLFLSPECISVYLDRNANNAHARTHSH